MTLKDNLKTPLVAESAGSIGDGGKPPCNGGPEGLGKAKQRPWRLLTGIPDGQGTVLRPMEGSSLRSTVFNLINSMIGGGILGLPYATKKCGILLGPIMIACVAIMGDRSSWMVVYCMDAMREQSYANIMKTLYGSWMGIAVDLAVLLNAFGTCVSYLVIIGDLEPDFLAWVGAPTAISDRTNVLVFSSFFVLFPLSSFRSMGALRHVSFACLLMIVVFVLTVTAVGVGLIPVEPVSGSHSGEEQAATSVFVPKGMFDVMCQLPVMFFAFIAQQNLPFLYTELRRQTWEDVKSKYLTKRSKMMTGLHIGHFVSLTAYGLAAVCGFLAFGENTNPDVLTNFDFKLFSWAPYLKVAYSSVLFFSFPVMCFSCRASLHRLAWHCVHAMQQLPVVRDADVASPRDLFAPPHVLPGEEHLMSECSSFKPSETMIVPSPSEFLRISEVAIIVVSTCFCAVIVPNVSVVFSLTGGVCCGSLMYTFPGLMYAKIRQDENQGFIRQVSGHSISSEHYSPENRRRAVFAGRVVFLFGLVSSVLSTAVVVWQLVSP